MGRRKSREVVDYAKLKELGNQLRAEGQIPVFPKEGMKDLIPSSHPKHIARKPAELRGLGNDEATV